MNQEDRDHPTLKDRLEARKIATLESYDGEGINAFTTHALLLAGLAEPTERTKKKAKGKNQKAGEADVRTTPELPPPRRVGVIVNRVDLARRVFAELQSKAEDKVEVLLLTGRVRPLDRARLMPRLKPLLAKPDRPEPERPIILVATQTIEAGADLDLDALVTEIAPIDALRQRFGRLDRLGEREISRAVILYPAGKPQKSDARAPWSAIGRIYGNSAYETKEWLQALGETIDFGINALSPTIESLSVDRLQSLVAPRLDAPSLLPAYADLWSRTSPAPAATPEASLFLHGRQKAVDVQVVWRADIDLRDEKRINRSLESCPPSALEALPLPIWALRSWLRKEGIPAVFSDVTESLPEERRNGPPPGPSVIVVWRDEQWRIRRADERLTPGEMIVLPASAGGWDEWGWNPRSDATVEDVGSQAHYQQRLYGTLRVTEATLLNVLASERPDDARRLAREIWPRIEAWIQQQADEATGRDARSLLLAEHDLPTIWRTLLEAGNERAWGLEFYDDETPEYGFILATRAKLKADLLKHDADSETEQGDEAITDREDSWSVGRRVKLTCHLERTRGWAREFAQRAGLGANTCQLVELAARLHDVGKVDRRFQADLRGQSALVLANPDLVALLEPKASDEFLAKSERSGWRRDFKSPRAVPDYFRHESLSVALAERNPQVRELCEDDRDLVLWLIGTHHGCGRPFFPPCIDDQRAMRLVYDGMKAQVGDAPLRLDQGWIERADRLNRRYGPVGTCPAGSHSPAGGPPGLIRRGKG